MCNTRRLLDASPDGKLLLLPKYLSTVASVTPKSKICLWKADEVMLPALAKRDGTSYFRNMPLSAWNCVLSYLATYTSRDTLLRDAAWEHADAVPVSVRRSHRSSASSSKQKYGMIEVTPKTHLMPNRTYRVVFQKHPAHGSDTLRWQLQLSFPFRTAAAGTAVTTADTFRFETCFVHM